MRNQSHGDESGEAQTGAASKKYGSGSAPNVPLNRRSTPSPRTYAGAQYRSTEAPSTMRARREPARAAHHRPSANPAPTPIATVPNSIHTSAAYPRNHMSATAGQPDHAHATPKSKWKNARPMAWSTPLTPVSPT